MTEAQLRAVASELFLEMGMEDSPDTLDFFQKNAENGDSSEWKKCLKSPSTRVARRTSSDGTTLVHLKKKYSTGLVSDQDQPTRSIKASDIEVSPSNRSRKFSPSQKQKNRFGYSSSTAKVADATTISKCSSETKPVASGYNSEEGKAKGMFKVKKKGAAAVVGSHSIRGIGASKRPTSVIGGRSPRVRPFGKSASNGSIPTRSGSNLPLSSKHQISSPTSSAVVKPNHNDAALGNGPQSSIPRPGTQPTHSRSSSHGSAALLAANSAAQTHKEAETGKKTRTISLAHSSIDTTKLSSINMRSLTRTKFADDAKTPERKISDSGTTERKISDNGTEKKHSFIPLLSQAAAAAPSKPTSNDATTATSPTETAGGLPKSNSTTQVLYSRKPSFKLIPMATSSRRIMHTVQDGGIPKRHNTISSKSPQPPQSTTGPMTQHNNDNPRPAQARVVKETVVLRHAKENPKPQKAEIQETSAGYDSLPVKDIKPSEKDAQLASQVQSTGGYDRLSPPIQNPQTVSKQEPFYDTIDDHVKGRDPSSQERKISNGSKAESHPNRHLKLRSTKTAEVRAMTRTDTAPASLNTLSSPCREQHADEAFTTMPTEHNPSDRIRADVEERSKLTQDNKNEKTLQAVQNFSNKNGDLRFQRKLSGGKKIPHSIPRYTSKSGDTYSLVSKSKAASSQTAQKRTSLAGAVEEISRPSAEVPRVVQLPRSVTTPSFTKTTDSQVTNSTSNQHHHHRPLQASLSDSSTARTTPISFKVQAASNESVEIGNLLSSTSGASSEQELLRGGSGGALVPRGGGPMMASMERKARLDVNWSEQSLDRNMAGMVTTTVEALGNLVEAISSPPDNKSDEGR